jgi:hypothetical protein
MKYQCIKFVLLLMAASVAIGLAPVPGTWTSSPEFIVGTYTVVNSSTGGTYPDVYVYLSFSFTWPYPTTPKVTTGITKVRSKSLIIQVQLQ